LTAENKRAQELCSKVQASSCDRISTHSAGFSRTQPIVAAALFHCAKVLAHRCADCVV